MLEGLLWVAGIVAVFVFLGRSHSNFGLGTVKRHAREETQWLRETPPSEVLRKSLRRRSRAITSKAIARSKARGRAPAPWNVEGHVYIARAVVRDSWSIANNRAYRHLPDDDPDLIALRAEFKRVGESELYKVGHTRSDPASRVRQLNEEADKPYRSIYEPFEFKLLDSWETDKCFEVELQAHRILREHKVVGEIFAVTEAEARAAVAQASESYDRRPRASRHHISEVPKGDGENFESYSLAKAAAIALAKRTYEPVDIVRTEHGWAIKRRG